MVTTDLEIIKDPDSWPIWPVLPMKRHGVLGYFYNTSASYSTVQFFLGNIYEQDKAIELLTTPEAVLSAGWRID